MTGILVGYVDLREIRDEPTKVIHFPTGGLRGNESGKDSVDVGFGKDDIEDEKEISLTRSYCLWILYSSPIGYEPRKITVYSR